MTWDQRCRQLEEGEIIRPGDECLTDKEWKPAAHTIGQGAACPRYTSHRWYRRKRNWLVGWWCVMTHPIKVFVGERICAYRRWRHVR